MAFSFGNAGAFGALQQQQSAPQGQVQNGQDLPEITTEALGFLAIAGEAKVQLLPTPWPKDNLPPSTANLLSIASRRGLAAAAGPESVIVARTESIRKAFSGERTGDGQIRAFTPEMTLPLGMRVSQVAFTADENYLVLSAEQGGGLAVYEVDSILKGNTESAFQMPTGGQNLRALVPNPTPDMGGILALATMDGKLMVADLKERSFAKVNNSEALTENVSCISWSARGKQLVAGLADGSASQFTPQGVLKAQISRPPSLDANHHVSSITWLENDVFLMVHNPSNSDDHPPQSTFHLVTRAKGTQQYMYQKLSDPSPNFGLDRSPPHHFMLRLRDFPPALSDVLIVASTASTDIGIFTKSATPLTSDKPSNEITNVFTLTEMADDSRRAGLPVNDDLADTSPIGAALDLSSNELVARPIPGDEMDFSKTPLPGLMVLNNEGVLSSWWVAYNDSIRQGTVYPGLAAAGSMQAAAPTPTSAGAFGQSAFGASTSSTNAFGGSIGGGSAFGAPSALAKPSPWGAPAATTSAFGTPPATTTAAPKPAGGAFGAPAFGAPAFGAPAFGSPSAPAPGKPAFGATGFGQRASPWAAGTTTAATPAFGQSGLGGAAAAPKPAAPFGSAVPASGGFASFASKPGFAGVAATGGESIFGKPAAGGSAFGKPVENASPFGGAAAAAPGGSFGGGTPPAGSAFGSTAPSTTAFGSTAPLPSAFGSTPSTGSAFGAAAPSTGGAFGSGGAFKLGSTFTADASAKNDNEKPDTGGSMFGGGFGKVLGEVKEAQSVPSPEANMDDDVEEPAQPETKPEAPAPTNVFGKPAAPATQTSSLFGAKPADAAAPTSSLFGAKPAAPATSLFGAKPAAGPAAAPAKAGFSFGTPAAAPAAAGSDAKPSLFGNTNKTTPAFGSAFGALKEEKKTTPPQASMPEAPLPPDPSSKPLFGVGESSASSQSNDAPLPPDFTKAKPKAASDDAPLPPDFTKVKPKADFEDAPLPPDFAPGKPKPAEKKEEEPKIKQEESSSPVILPAAGNDEDGSEGFSEEEPGQWSESDEGENEAEEDEEESTTPREDKSHTPEDSPEQQSLFSKRSKPTGRQLFGEINKSEPSFAPPSQRGPLRSPSPVRSSLPPHMRGRPDANRSVSAPMAASQILGNRAPPSKPEFKETLQYQQEEDERRARAAKQKEIDEAQALVDEDDERTQEYLNMEIAPTLRLDEFVAHQDYVHDPTKDSVPYQVEAVFRDINAMIDTLGMNSRSLQAFIRGHSELYPDTDRTREDLEKDDEWCMDEIERLDKIIEFDLREALDEGRIHDVEKKVKICQELGKETTKLTQRKNELQALLSTTLDPEYAAMARTQPLTAEQATHQHELRASFAKLQKQIAEAEEALVLLRTKLASVAGVNGKSAPGPTVEAVIRTVTKMTAMAEKRSGDIDVLENQMRRLRFSSVASDRDRTPTREMSPFNSPLKQSFRNSVAYERPYTPERRMPGNFRDSFSASMRSSRGFDPSASMRSDRTFNPSASMRSSGGYDPRASMRSDRSYATPQRKKLDGFTKDDQNKIKGRAEKRKEVTEMVKKALEKRGARVYPMD